VTRFAVTAFRRRRLERLAAKHSLDSKREPQKV